MKKYNKILSTILAGTISITSLSTFVTNNKVEAKRINGRTNHNTPEKNIENIALTPENIAYFNLLEKMPTPIAEGDINNSIKWLNENKPNTLKFGNFIATSEGYVKFQSYERSWSCIVAVGNALVTLMPWAKILKIKQGAKVFGGIQKVASSIYSKYKYLTSTYRSYRNNKWLAMKTAVSQTTSSMPGDVRTAFMEFFGVGGLSACYE